MAPARDRITGDWLASPPVQLVLGAFSRAGKAAYLVGGCVRDAILGRPVSDVDVATDARPADGVAIAEAEGIRVLPLGIDHGSIRLILGGRNIEVTTFRSDVETDGRHATVAFGTSMEADARRRDFTMNALYADAAGRVYDPLLGTGDLLDGRVRFIGDAGERIREDFLRILRYFRFLAAYGDRRWPLDMEALAACRALAPGIDRLSGERVTAEVVKLLTAEDPVSSVAAMDGCGVLGRILPGATPATLATFVAMERRLGLDPCWWSRLAALSGSRDRLRLSRRDAGRIAKVGALADGVESAAGLGYREGETTATGAVLLRAVRSGREHPGEDAMADIRRGSSARFPIRAADLGPDLKGRRLGERLRALETRWIESGFTLSRSGLLGETSDRPERGGPSPD
ncbi:MAG: CCA tRNA nucleotidyltransferase [Paracoccaceae bacterium]|nr:CCA tRNA nucleotidyltransferase [Paracoccaceae bacterium]